MNLVSKITAKMVRKLFGIWSTIVLAVTVLCLQPHVLQADNIFVSSFDQMRYTIYLQDQKKKKEKEEGLRKLQQQSQLMEEMRRREREHREQVTQKIAFEEPQAVKVASVLEPENTEKPQEATVVQAPSKPKKQIVQLPYTLNGVIWNVQESLAIIEQQVYSLGDQLPDGWEIIAITRNTVTLVQGQKIAHLNVPMMPVETGSLEEENNQLFSQNSDNSQNQADMSPVLKMEVLN